jgi:hypothetical protein
MKLERQQRTSLVPLSTNQPSYHYSPGAEELYHCHYLLTGPHPSISLPIRILILILFIVWR